MITNATEGQLDKALFIINKNKYEGNVIFNERKHISKNRIRFTLRVIDSHKPGHRRGQSPCRKDGRGRTLINACWHVHGDFFDALFHVNPELWVRSAGRTVNIKKGNWVDRNIGSIMEPLRYSDACDCGEDGLNMVRYDGKEATAKVTYVSQNRLSSECWTIQFLGLSACKDCEFVDTDDCGGKEIRARKMNEKGIPVPLSTVHPIYT